MFPFARSEPWIGVVWLIGLFAAAFGVTWLATDVGRMRRTPYIGLLSLVTGGLAGGFLWWSGAGVRFWARSWSWAIVGAVATTFFMMIFARRLPRLPTPAHLGRVLAWEAVVYGAAEGLLLSVLPVAITWQIWRSSRWTFFGAPAVGAAAAVSASAALIVIHHLGYWEFRGPLMRYPVVLCSVLSLAYLLTGNPIPAIVGHIVFHAAMVRKGIELPPHARPPVSVDGQFAANAAVST